MKMFPRTSNLALLSLACVLLTSLVNYGHGLDLWDKKVQKQLIRDALRRQVRMAQEEPEDISEPVTTTGEASTTDENAAESEADVTPSSSTSSPEMTTSSPVNGSSIFIVKKNATKIDWDEVERNWYAFEEDDVVRKKWENMQKGLKKGMTALLGAIIPNAVSMSSQLKVSGDCSAGVLNWVFALKDLKGWSFKMLDALGKPPPGIFEGASAMFGNYHECVKIRVFEEREEDEDDEAFGDEVDTSETKPVKKKEPGVEQFRGKYCVMEFKPTLPKKPAFYGMETRLPALQGLDKEDDVFKEIIPLAVFLNFAALRFDVCLPSLCRPEDLQKIVNFLTKALDMRGRVLRCETESDTLIPEPMNSAQFYALMRILIHMLVFGGLTLAAYFSFCNCCKPNSTVRKFLTSLTWSHAYQELTDTECYQKGYKVGSLYGLRNILVLWVILVQSVVLINFQFFRELMFFKDLALAWGAQFVTKASSVQFDSLICLTAFSLAYSVGSSGGRSAAKAILRKYFRIVPVVLFAGALVALLPLARNMLYGSATWGDFVPKPSKACQNYGLYNVFFLQNFAHPDQVCLPHTWILCVELQLAIAFIPVFILLSTKKVFAYVTLVILVVIGFALNVENVIDFELPPALLLTIPDPEQRNFYYQVHYFKPWTHLSTFALGVLAGHLAYHRKRKDETSFSAPKSRNFVYTMGAMLSSGVLFAVLHSHHEWIKGIWYSEAWLNGLFDGLFRILWSGAQAYIFYYISTAVDSDKNSIIRKILCSHNLIVLGRLSLTAYICYPLAFYIFLGTQQTHIFSSLILLGYGFIANIVFLYVLSFAVSILVELPSASLTCAREPNSSLLKRAKEAEMYSNKSTIKKGLPVTTIGLRNGTNGDLEMTKDYPVQRL